MATMEFRAPTRDAHCRGCDKLLKRNEEKAIYFYSYRNTGQHIWICVKCIDRMNGLSREDEDVYC